MSDANLTKILYVAEEDFATVPTPTPKLRELRFLSASPTHGKVTVLSEEIRSDRSRRGLIEVGKNGSGSLETEFVVGHYNDLILGALLAVEWAEDSVSVEGDLVVAAGNGTFTLGSGSYSAEFRGAKYVRVTGFATEGNNGVKRVVSATENSVTLAGMTTNESTVTPTLAYKYARNGVDSRSFVIEEQFLGLEPDHFAHHVGVSVNQWEISMEAQARVMQTFTFMGARGFNSSQTVGDGSPTLPSTRPICNTTGNIGMLFWDGEGFSSNVMNLSMALNNNLRERQAIAREFTLQHGKGLCAPDGQINAYFEDPDLLTSFVNHESASLLIPIVDAEGNVFSIFMPHIEFPSGWPTIEGINTDIMLPLDYNATFDQDLGFVIQVDQVDLVAAGGSPS